MDAKREETQMRRRACEALELLTQNRKFGMK
jgi:hypothetical protein